jgi:hypothetical protein
MNARPALTHPAAPASSVLAACAVAAVAGLTTSLPAVVLGWALLGITAGYSISGSV